MTQPTCSLSTLHDAGHPSTAQDSLPACWLGINGIGLSPIGLQTRISRDRQNLLSQRARLNLAHKRVPFWLWHYGIATPL